MEVFGVKQTPDEAFPSGYVLNLVKKERTGSVAKLRIAPVIDIGYAVQVRNGHGKQTFIFEVHVKYGLLGVSLRQQVRDHLEEKPSLARSAHAYYGVDLVRQPWDPGMTSGKGR